jgi:integrase
MEQPGEPGEKPSGRAAEPRWLENDAAALLLEAARTVALIRGDLATPCLYPLIATFLLTGGRRAEVLGLEVSDLSFDRRTVTFRPNDWRRLKTSTSRRTVPLWPQLEEILRAYVFNPDRPPTRLLFPRYEGGRERLVTNFDKALDQVAIAVGFWEEVRTATGEVVKNKAGEPVRRGTVRTKAFRHTYCSTRLQTLDRGAPVSIYTVGKELGHGGDSLVKRVYGHLGEVRHRSELVECRIEHHAERLAERLASLRPRGTVAAPGAGLPLSDSLQEGPPKGSTRGSAVPSSPVSS